MTILSTPCGRVHFNPAQLQKYVPEYVVAQNEQCQLVSNNADQLYSGSVSWLKCRPGGIPCGMWHTMWHTTWHTM